MNINNKLVKFASEDLILARTANEREKINKSLAHLKKILEYSLGNEIDSIIPFGSFTRNTILPRGYDLKSDIDLLVIFNTSNGVLTTDTYRNKLKKVLEKAYPNSLSKKDFPVVKLELNHIRFDIVPAYKDESFFWETTRFFIPNKKLGWMKTYPNDINKPLANKNQSIGNNTIRNVIRLCKHWNSGAGYPLESYLMEKSIIDLIYWGDENTYDRFLKTLSSIAGNRPSVKLALTQIEKHQGNWYTDANPEKELLWVKKLLPGLH